MQTSKATARVFTIYLKMVPSFALSDLLASCMYILQFTLDCFQTVSLLAPNPHPFLTPNSAFSVNLFLASRQSQLYCSISSFWPKSHLFNLYCLKSSTSSASFSFFCHFPHALTHPSPPKPRAPNAPPNANKQHFHKTHFFLIILPFSSP